MYTTHQCLPLVLPALQICLLTLCALLFRCTLNFNNNNNNCKQAGNLNSAIFNLSDPSKAPLIGEAKMVLVNDARHQLKPDFLQRTMPYFFELDTDGMTYKWGKYAFVQTPQRFQVGY
jgi:cellulose synthase/poly-beta-1,6-N-acetylglucosamine synthase-like glycosyltransferase